VKKKPALVGGLFKIMNLAGRGTVIFYSGVFLRNRCVVSNMFRGKMVNFLEFVPPANTYRATFMPIPQNS
jgi:hypothetical protein